MTLTDHFDCFREHFSSVRLVQYDWGLVYKCGGGMAEKQAKEANELIERLNLPLVAIPKSNHPKDSFYVQSNETEV